MTAAEKRRLEDLERRVRELEARPPQIVTVPVYVQPQPIVYPAPYVPPCIPYTPPYPWTVTTTCGSDGDMAGVSCVGARADTGELFTTGQLQVLS